LGGEKLFEEIDIAAVFFPAGAFFYAIEEFRACEGNGHALDFVNDDAFRRLGVVDAVGTGHEVDEDFIGHADERVFGDVASFEFADTAVGESRERGEHARSELAWAVSLRSLFFVEGGDAGEGFAFEEFERSAAAG